MDLARCAAVEATRPHYADPVKLQKEATTQHKPAETDKLLEKVGQLRDTSALHFANTGLLAPLLRFFHRLLTRFS